MKQANYRHLIDELRKTQVSEDAADDQFVRNTIANCGYGMLEKQINRSQKIKLFDTYEEPSSSRSNTEAPSPASSSTRREASGDQRASSTKAWQARTCATRAP